MNLDGKSIPNPHPAWGVCAEELLFYTSRYAGYAARRLSELGADPGIDLAGFQACSMSPTQRAWMARLLAMAPDPPVVRTVAALAATVACGASRIPQKVRKVAGKRRLKPHLQVAALRPRHSTDLKAVSPIEVLRHLGSRYGFRVLIAGNHVWLKDARLARLLRHEGTRQAANVQEVLDALQRCEYRLHLPESPDWSSDRRTAN